MTPDICIAIPTRNRHLWLHEAIASALAQDYPGIEVLVSDNASTDDTPNTIAAFGDRIRSFQHSQDCGMVGNWNALLGMARAPWFLLLCDDDRLEPICASHLLTLTGGNTRLVYGRVRYIDQDGCLGDDGPLAPTEESGWAFANRRLVGTARPYLCAFAFRTDDLRRMGGFPEVGNLSDLAAQVACARLGGTVRFSEQRLGLYRRHVASLTNDTDRLASSLLQVRTWLEATAPELTKPIRRYCRTALADLLAQALRDGNANEARNRLEEVLSLGRWSRQGVMARLRCCAAGIRLQ